MVLTHFRMLTACLLVILMPVSINAQDTAFVYDIAGGVESFIVLPAYDSTVTADSLPPYYGNYGVTAMPTTKPVDTLPFSSVSKPFVVTDSFNTFNFPFTAVTKCSYFLTITAAVIGRHALLVFNYDVYNTNAPGWRNPYPVKPLFNNGSIQFGHSQLTPVRFYGLSSLMWWNHVGIIEVAEDIGGEAGYFGLAFDTTELAFSDEKMLYNISYPAETGPNVGYLYNDSIRGDTMYMRYGNVVDMNTTSVWFGRGGNGEYVSPLFDDSYRIRAFRWDYDAFTVITPRYFNFLKYVLQNLATNVEEVEEDKEGFTVYPNPTNGNFYVKGKGTYAVYDVTGKQVLEGSAGKSFNLSTPGLYFVKNMETNEVKKLVVTK